MIDCVFPTCKISRPDSSLNAQVSADYKHDLITAGPDSSLNTQVSADYKHDLITAGSTVDPLKSTVSTAAAFSFSKFRFGFTMAISCVSLDSGTLLDPLTLKR